MFQSDLFPAGEQLPSMPLAYAIGTRVAALLASGRHLTRTDISGLFAEETGVLDWGGAWTIDDYNSAVEIGALLWLRDSSRIDLATNVHEAEARFDWLEAALPPRHVRSEAQVDLQQFSTPPMLAWLMAKAAAVCAQDTLLEPSAGNGALALWGCLQNASLLLNEIDPARRDSLAHVFAKRYADAVLRMILLNGEFHGDPHPGNVFWMEGNQVGFIDFGSVGFLSGARRQEIVRLIFAIANDQIDKVADLLLDWAGNPLVDRAQLAMDLDELIEEFRGTALAGIEFSAIFDRVFGLLREYRLVLPPDLAILLRTLLTAEGFVRSLAPDYNIAEETKPIVMQLFAERFSIGAARDHLAKVRSGLLDFSASLPELIENVASVARSGTIQVSIDPASLNHLTREEDRSTPVKGPVVAALIVSAALLADQSLLLAGIVLAFAGIALIPRWN